MKRLAIVCGLGLCLLLAPLFGRLVSVAYGAPFAVIPSAEFIPTNLGTSIIDTATDTVIETCPNSAYALRSLTGVAANCGDGAAYTTYDGAADQVCKIDLASCTVTCISVNVGQPVALACVPQTNRLYVSGLNAGADYLGVVEIPAFQDLGTYYLGSDSSGWPVAIAANSIGHQVYVTNYSGTIYVVDTDTLTVSTTLTPIDSNTSVNGIAVTPDGNYLYVAAYGRTGNAGELQGYDVTKSPPTSVADVSLGAGSIPFGVAISAVGDRVYLTDEGLDEMRVWAIGSTGGLTAESTIPLPTGSHGQGLDVTAPGKGTEEIYVCLYSSNEVQHFTYNKSTYAYSYSFIPVVPSPSCLGKFLTSAPATGGGGGCTISQSDSGGALSSASLMWLLAPSVVLVSCRRRVRVRLTNSSRC